MPAVFSAENQASSSNNATTRGELAKSDANVMILAEVKVVVVSKIQEPTSTSQSSQTLPEELHTIEEALKQLNGALMAL